MIPFKERSELTKKFQDKVCSNQKLASNECINVSFCRYSLAQMVSILLWIQTKKIKLRNDLKFRGSTYRPIWAKNAPTDNKEERDIDPCPVFINLTDNSNYHYISNYNGYSPQIGN